MADTSRPKPSGASVLLTAAAFVVVVAGMRAAEPIIVPFLLSVFIAIICAPPLFVLEARGMPRWLAMLIVISGIIAVAVGLSVLVGTSLNEFYRDLPQYKSKINAQAGQLIGWLQNRGVQVSKEEILGHVKPGDAIQLVGDIFNGFGGALANAFLIFLTVVFILFETSSFPRKLRSVMDDPEHAMDKFARFNENVKRYLTIKTLASLGTGIAIGIWLAILGVDYAVLWGVLAFLLNYVPNIGSIVAAVPAVLVALIQSGPFTAVWAAVGYLIVNVLFGNVIEPRFLGRGLGLSTLVVFLSLVFWGWILGPVGMFLSVPLTMLVKIALDSRDDTRWIAVMLGPERGLEPPRATPAPDEPADPDAA